MNGDILQHPAVAALIGILILTTCVDILVMAVLTLV